MWEKRAKYIEQVYHGYVNWKELYYICPNCGKIVSFWDWDDFDMAIALCPICGFDDYKEEDDSEEYLPLISISVSVEGEDF